MKKELNIKRVIIVTFIIVFSAVALFVFYYFLGRTFFESSYCKGVRKEKNISRIRYPDCRDVEYNYQDNNFHDVIFSNPNSKFPDEWTIQLDPDTKEIINEFITS